jgi:hypothetical protein
VDAHVGPQTQHPGGESIVFLGQDQVARGVLPAVQGRRTAESQRTHQMVALGGRLHKGLSGREVAGSCHISAIPEGKKG